MPNYRGWIRPPRESCVICGARSDEVQFHHDDTCSSECFTKKFWNEKVEWAEAGDAPYPGGVCIRVRHVHYVTRLRDDDDALVEDHGQLMGFGGAVWYGQFISGPHSGRVWRSNDVWCQGDIPQDYHDDLPDNCRFIAKEEYELLTTEPQSTPAPGLPDR